MTETTFESTEQSEETERDLKEGRREGWESVVADEGCARRWKKNPHVRRLSTDGSCLEHERRRGWKKNPLSSSMCVSRKPYPFLHARPLALALMACMFLSWWPCRLTAQHHTSFFSFSLASVNDTFLFIFRSIFQRPVGYSFCSLHVASKETSHKNNEYFPSIIFKHFNLDVFLVFFEYIFYL
jgi:hypothetical protein